VQAVSTAKDCEWRYSVPADYDADSPDEMCNCGGLRPRPITFCRARSAIQDYLKGAAGDRPVTGGLTVTAKIDIGVATGEPGTWSISKALRR